MAAVSLTDLGSQQAEIERRRRMAEMLQQQSAQPIEIQSYKGTQAPIPWTAVLASVLQNYGAAHLQRSADKQEREAKKQARDEASKFLSEQAVDPGMSLNEGLADPSKISARMGLAERLRGAVAPKPKPQAQALGAALAGEQPPQPMQQAPMPAPVQQGARFAGVPELPTVRGQRAPGNVEPWNRPILHNPDGGYSTTSSMSIGTDKGEVLIPTVVNGKRLSPADAIAHYRATGENLGTFDKPGNADAYAQELHNRQNNYVQANGGPANFDPTQAPQQAVSPMAPPEMAAQAPAFDPRRSRSMQEQQDRLLQASMSGNPYLEKLAPALYEHNQARGDKTEDLQYATQAKAADRQSEFAMRAALQQMKPEERTAMQKDFGFAQSQGFKGGFMDFMNAYHPQFISPQPGQSVYNARDLAEGGGGSQPPVSREQVLASITEQFPGARVTSTDRTPAQNAAANGVPNSAHLTGHAVDFVLGSHEEMQAAADRINAQGLPGVRALYEGPGAKNSTGPHVHVQVAQGGGGGAPRPVAVGAPKPGGRMATAEEKARLGLAPDAPYWIEPDGKPVAVQGEKPNKPLTEYQGKSVEYMNAALSGNERLNELAKAGIYKPSTATDSLFSREKDGTIRFIGRSEKDRQFIQAAKEWLAPILRKDTGAAVTDGEVQQYMDIYIPRYEDPLSVMRQKAQARDAKMRSLYGANKSAYDQTFGDPGKWQVLTDSRALTPKGGQAKYNDPGKEARYQAWLKANGGH
jgi:hypothetical protein